MKKILVALIISVLGFIGIVTPATSFAAPAGCKEAAAALAARIQAHNAEPHSFKVPEQVAQAAAYNARAAQLRAEVVRLRARCNALPAAQPKNITGYTKHGNEQRLSRDGHGVSDRAIRDAVHNPAKVVRSQGRYGYQWNFFGRDAVVVLNSRGQVVTCWSKGSRGWRY